MTDPFVVDKRILGTNKHLLVNGSFTWIANVPEDTWHLSGELKTSNKCLDTLFKLENVTVELNPPERYFNAMTTLLSSSGYWPPPWHDVMPPRVHRTFVETLIARVVEAFNRADQTFYRTVWVPGNAVFGSLQRAVIDEEKRASYVRANEGNLAALESFRPDEQGFAPAVTYNRFGQRTGRPSVLTGPQILTLKREHRDILTSRWKGEGQIVMLDFSALEVRVILHEAGKFCKRADLYAELNDDLFAGRMPRDAVKGAVICDLYGQSKHALGNRLGIKGRHLDFFINKIRSHFETDKLLQRVKQQFVKEGSITNHYGRRVVIDSPLDHIIVNAYAQSTGADVVTLGFHEILKRLHGRRVVPLFVLVDAIILDCHLSELDAVREIDSVKVDGYDQVWPLKLDTL